MTTDEAGNGAEEEEEENTRDEYAENGNPMVEAPGNGRLAAEASDMGDETGAEALLSSTEEKGATVEAKREEGAGGGESKPCEGNPRLMAGERNGVSPLKLGRLLIGLPDSSSSAEAKAVEGLLTSSASKNSPLESESKVIPESSDKDGLREGN